MKKTLAIVSAIVSAIFLLTFSSPGQTDGGGDGGGSSVPYLPMIQSQDAMRNYALSIARVGNRWINAQSIDWDWSQGKTSTRSTGQFGEAILDDLFKETLIYKMSNLDDEVTGYINLYDRDGNDANLLFFGVARYSARDLLEGGKPTYEIWMQRIPLPIDGVRVAEVLAQDEDGRTARRYPLEIKNGQPLFDPWMAGAVNGILSIKLEDGRLFTFRLSTPVGEAPESAKEVAQFKIDGHHIFRAGEKPLFVKIVEAWTLPSAFIQNSWAGAEVAFDVAGLVQKDGSTYFERPVSVEFVNQVTGLVETLRARPDEPIKVILPVGNFRVRFNWIEFGKPGNLYTGPEEPTGMDEKG